MSGTAFPRLDRSIKHFQEEGLLKMDRREAELADYERLPEPAALIVSS